LRVGDCQLSVEFDSFKLSFQGRAWQKLRVSEVAKAARIPIL